MKGTWWQAACPDPRMPGGLHGALPPFLLYSSESGVEMMGGQDSLKSSRRSLAGAVFHGILPLD